MSHTPKPWKASSAITNFVTSEDGKVHIAVAFDVAESAPSPEEARANAKLIGMAPDLLDDAKWFIQLLDDKVLVRNIDDDHQDDFDQRMFSFVNRLKQVMDHIDKAEGK